MDAQFTVTLSDADWDGRLGGWKCEALKIPGAVLSAVYHGGHQADPRGYKADGQAIVWAAETHPGDVLARITLTKDLPEIERDRLRLEQEKVSIERSKVTSEGRWKIISALGAALSAILTFVGSHLMRSSNGNQALPDAASRHVVPIVNAATVGKLPEESGDSQFSLSKDISVFDLRSWAPVPENKKNTRHSPVNYINYLHLKKKQDVGRYVAHYSTGGYAIDLRCITHPAQVLQTQSPDHPGEKTYSLDVDVSHEKVGSDFLIVVEGTYWNGFSNERTESASTYTDTDITNLGELALVVLFPEQKPFKKYSFGEKSETATDFVQYADNSRFYVDRDNHFIFWSVTGRKPNSHYKLTWDW